MKIKHLKYPLVKLPPGVDLTLFLIKEELKSRKFFNGLRNLGLDGCFYQTHLEKLIMANVGLNEESDKDFDYYYDLIEKYSKKIEADNESVTKQALKVYVELIIEKKRRLGAKVI